MAAFLPRLDAAAAQATCEILTAAGGGLVGSAGWALFAGGPVLAPLALGGLALLTSAYGCNWDPEAPSTLPPGSGIAEGQCMETVGCDLMLKRKGGAQQYTGPVRKLISSVATGTYPNGTPKCTTRWIDCDGIEQTDDEAIEDLWPITTEVREGGQCVGDPSPPPEPGFPKYYYEDIDNNCSLEVEVLGFGVEADGTTAPIFKISPDPRAIEGGTRNSGGVIGGCNFEPVIYYNPVPPYPPDGPVPPVPPNPPNPPIPFPPGPDGPDGPEWLDKVKDMLTTAAGVLLGNILADLFQQPVEGVQYEMLAPCDVDEEGNQLVWTGDIPAQQFQTAVLDRLDALSNQVSTHLAWKTPICPPVPTQLEGDFRTISFRSDETSPYGKSRLRKRLRYRSLSGVGLGELVDYWKDFTWEAGPVVVGHVGATWGTPKVWAASEDEGKRVLRHAAGDAGIDPDQEGQWQVRSSAGTRNGVSGTMRVNKKGGYWWITARDGADNRPIVAT